MINSSFASSSLSLDINKFDASILSASTISNALATFHRNAYALHLECLSPHLDVIYHTNNNFTVDHIRGAVLEHHDAGTFVLAWTADKEFISLIPTSPAPNNSYEKVRNSFQHGKVDIDLLLQSVSQFHNTGRHSGEVRPSNRNFTVSAVIERLKADGLHSFCDKYGYGVYNHDHSKIFDGKFGANTRYVDLKAICAITRMLPKTRVMCSHPHLQAIANAAYASETHVLYQSLLALSYEYILVHQKHQLDYIFEHSTSLNLNEDGSDISYFKQIGVSLRRADDATGRSVYIYPDHELLNRVHIHLPNGDGKPLITIVDSSEAEAVDTTSGPELFDIFCNAAIDTRRSTYYSESSPLVRDVSYFNSTIIGTENNHVYINNHSNIVSYHGINTILFRLSEM